MRWGDDTEEAFPPRHPREPGGLRQDILDEIADHLACAAEREADRGGENDNEETVWGRVLERFGNPDAIARKLWWDEMRETVMREWIQTGVMVAVAVAVVVFMTLVTRQMSTANQAVLEALKSNATAVNPLVTLKVKVPRGTEDGPAAEGVRVILNGAAFGGESTFVSRGTDAAGNLQFGPMQPGQYRIYSFDPQSGLTSDSRTETLFAGETDGMITIVAPEAQLVSTQLTFDTPFTLSGNRALQLWIESTWGHGETGWNRRMEVLTDGSRWWTRYTDPFGDEQPPSLNDVDSQGLVIGATWKDVLLEGDAIRMSGEVVKIRAALLEDEEGHHLRRVLDEELSRTEYRPDAKVQGYQLTLPESFQRYIVDLEVEEHAAARGIELDGGLWSALRTSYPTFLVDDAQLVGESKTGLLASNHLYNLAGYSDNGELAFASSFPPHNIDSGGVADARLVSAFRLPSTREFPEGTRVVLALRVYRASLDEFDNTLQAWTIPGDVFDSEWSSGAVVESPIGAPTVALGPLPVIEQTNETLLTSIKRCDWIVLDVTDALAQTQEATSPQGILLRWSRVESGYHNELELVASEAKLLENKPLRPLWLVLKPMAAEEVAAAQ